jgi:hypothetical protein
VTLELNIWRQKFSKPLFLAQKGVFFLPFSRAPDPSAPEDFEFFGLPAERFYSAFPMRWRDPKIKEEDGGI